jgi:hypothetical protein
MNRKLSAGFGSVLVAVALTIGGLVGAAPASADTTCPAGNVCFWPQLNFVGAKQIRGNSPEQIWLKINGAQVYRSLKNDFTNRAVWTSTPGVNLLCTSAGHNSAVAPDFTEYFVGPMGSTC